MKTKNALHNKNNFVNQITKVFDRVLVEKLANSSGFIIRRRSIKATDFFFSVCLLISDLGFFGIQRLTKIILQQAKFLSRLKFHVSVFVLKDGEYQLFDLLQEEKKMQPNEIKEYQVYIGRDNKLPVRLILEKADPKIASEKRRKLKTDKQHHRKSISAQRLKFCNVNAYVTNASSSELAMEKVRSYYTLRWQIEILFKAWKSVYKISDVKPMKLERFECMHYGLLTLIILTTQIFVLFKTTAFKMHKVELSELKFYTCIKESIHILIESFKTKQKQREYLTMLWEMVLITCKKDQKINRQSPFNIVNLKS